MALLNHEARDNQFLFQNVQNQEIYEISNVQKQALN